MRFSAMKVSRVKRGWRGVVKVQLSLSTTEACPQVLIYNKDSSLWYSGDADPEIMAFMNRRPRAFAHCRLDKNGCIKLDKEATEAEFLRD